MTRSFHVAAVGFGLIAVCYGFARFAFGLLLPQISAELSLPSTLSGLILSGAFLGYCIAIIFAAYWTERMGARAVAVIAALVAAIGMIGIASAPSAAWLAVSLFLAGSSTGLASPPLAAAVSACIRPERQAGANTFINAGTSAGVVLSGPIALMMGGSWRWAFVIFATVALAMAAFAAAYFGDRDRPFRRIVTAAQRAVLRVEILKHAVTMERFFRARQRQFGASPYAGMTVAARVLPAVKVRDFSAPATCYAGSERPGSAKSSPSSLTATSCSSVPSFNACISYLRMLI